MISSLWNSTIFFKMGKLLCRIETQDKSEDTDEQHPSAEVISWQNIVSVVCVMNIEVNSNYVKINQWFENKTLFFTNLILITDGILHITVVYPKCTCIRSTAASYLCEMLSSTGSSTESSGCTESSSKNSLNSAESIDSKLQVYANSNTCRLKKDQHIQLVKGAQSKILKSASLPVGQDGPHMRTTLPMERKSSLQESSLLTKDRVQIKKPKKDVRRAEIVAAVTRRLYTARKKVEKKTETDDPPPEKKEERADEEPEELKLCSRARAKLQELSRKALNVSNSRRAKLPGAEVETQTDFDRRVLRVKEKCVGTEVAEIPVATDDGHVKMIKHAAVETDDHFITCHTSCPYLNENKKWNGFRNTHCSTIQHCRRSLIDGKRERNCSICYENRENKDSLGSKENGRNSEQECRGRNRPCHPNCWHFCQEKASTNDTCNGHCTTHHHGHFQTNCLITGNEQQTCLCDQRRKYKDISVETVEMREPISKNIYTETEQDILNNCFHHSSTSANPCELREMAMNTNTDFHNCESVTCCGDGCNYFHECQNKLLNRGSSNNARRLNLGTFSHSTECPNYYVKSPTPRSIRNEFLVNSSNCSSYVIRNTIGIGTTCENVKDSFLAGLSSRQRIFSKIVNNGNALKQMNEQFLEPVPLDECFSDDSLDSSAGNEANARSNTSSRKSQIDGRVSFLPPEIGSEHYNVRDGTISPHTIQYCCSKLSSEKEPFKLRSEIILPTEKVNQTMNGLFTENNWLSDYFPSHFTVPDDFCSFKFHSETSREQQPRLRREGELRIPSSISSPLNVREHILVDDFPRKVNETAYEFPQNTYVERNSNIHKNNAQPYHCRESLLRTNTVSSRRGLYPISECVDHYISNKPEFKENENHPANFIHVNLNPADISFKCSHGIDPVVCRGNRDLSEKHSVTNLSVHKAQPFPENHTENCTSMINSLYSCSSHTNYERIPSDGECKKVIADKANQIAREFHIDDGNPVNKTLQTNGCHLAKFPDHKCGTVQAVEENPVTDCSLPHFQLPPVSPPDPLPSSQSVDYNHLRRHELNSPCDKNIAPVVINEKQSVFTQNISEECPHTSEGMLKEDHTERYSKPEERTHPVNNDLNNFNTFEDIASKSLDERAINYIHRIELFLCKYYYGIIDSNLTHNSSSVSCKEESPMSNIFDSSICYLLKGFQSPGFDIVVTYDSKDSDNHPQTWFPNVSSEHFEEQAIDAFDNKGKPSCRKSHPNSEEKVSYVMSLTIVPKVELLDSNHVFTQCVSVVLGKRNGRSPGTGLLFLDMSQPYKTITFHKYEVLSKVRSARFDTLLHFILRGVGGRNSKGFANIKMTFLFQDPEYQPLLTEIARRSVLQYIPLTVISPLSMNVREKRSHGKKPDQSVSSATLDFLSQLMLPEDDISELNCDKGTNNCNLEELKSSTVNRNSVLIRQPWKDVINVEKHVSWPDTKGCGDLCTRIDYSPGSIPESLVYLTESALFQPVKYRPTHLCLEHQSPKKAATQQLVRSTPILKEECTSDENRSLGSKPKRNVRNRTLFTSNDDEAVKVKSKYLRRKRRCGLSFSPLCLVPSGNSSNSSEQGTWFSLSAFIRKANALLKSLNEVTRLMDENKKEERAVCDNINSISSTQNDNFNPDLNVNKVRISNKTIEENEQKYVLPPQIVNAEGINTQKSITSPKQKRNGPLEKESYSTAPSIDEQDHEKYNNSSYKPFQYKRDLTLMDPKYKCIRNDKDGNKPVTSDTSYFQNHKANEYHTYNQLLCNKIGGIQNKDKSIEKHFTVGSLYTEFDTHAPSPRSAISMRNSGKGNTTDDDGYCDQRNIPLNYPQSRGGSPRIDNIDLFPRKNAESLRGRICGNLIQNGATHRGTDDVPHRFRAQGASLNLARLNGLRSLKNNSSKNYKHYNSPIKTLPPDKKLSLEPYTIPINYLQEKDGVSLDNIVTSDGISPYSPDNTENTCTNWTNSELLNRSSPVKLVSHIKPCSTDLNQRGLQTKSETSSRRKCQFSYRLDCVPRNGKYRTFFHCNSTSRKKVTYYCKAYVNTQKPCHVCGYVKTLPITSLSESNKLDANKQRKRGLLLPTEPRLLRMGMKDSFCSETANAERLNNQCTSPRAYMMQLLELRRQIVNATGFEINPSTKLMLREGKETTNYQQSKR